MTILNSWPIIILIMIMRHVNTQFIHEVAVLPDGKHGID